MSLTSKIESIIYKNTDIKENYITEKYFMTIEGYSLLSNIGFVKIEIGYGISPNDAFFRSLDKIGLDLFVNYNISINHMWTKDCRLYDSRNSIKSSNFGFYTLNDKLIQQFREDGERYCMSSEDK
jgi:hypothetical protein